MSGEHETFGEYVRRLRDGQHMSLADVRKKSGNEITVSYINQIERDEIRPDDISLGKLLSLAKGLGEDPDEILDRARGITGRRVEITPEQMRTRKSRGELMKLLFGDIPDDCQLDTLASMLGVHARRGQSLRIYQRSEARSAAQTKVASLIKELLGRDVSNLELPHSSGSPAQSDSKRGIESSSEKPDDESNDKNGPLRKTA